MKRTIRRMVNRNAIVTRTDGKRGDGGMGERGRETRSDGREAVKEREKEDPDWEKGSEDEKEEEEKNEYEMHTCGNILSTFYRAQTSTPAPYTIKCVKRTTRYTSLHVFRCHSFICAAHIFTYKNCLLLSPTSNAMLSSSHSRIRHITAHTSGEHPTRTGER